MYLTLLLLLLALRVLNKLNVIHKFCRSLYNIDFEKRLDAFKITPLVQSSKLISLIAALYKS